MIDFWYRSGKNSLNIEECGILKIKFLFYTTLLKGVNKMNNPNDYNDWLENSDLEDIKENHDWFDCPVDECADYIKNHSEWWDNL